MRHSWTTSTVLDPILIAAAFLMMLQISLDVIMRLVFKSSIIGTSVIVPNFYMIIMIFLGFTSVSRADDHIKVDLVANYFSPKLRVATDLIANIFTVAFFLFFTYALTRQAILSTQMNEQVDALFAFVDIWPMRWIAAIGIFGSTYFTIKYTFSIPDHQSS